MFNFTFFPSDTVESFVIFYHLPYVLKHTQNKSTNCGTNTHLSGGHHSTKKFKLKKGHNSKNIPFRVTSLDLQLHLVMIRKYSKFGVDTFNIFLVMGYIKVFAQQLWQRRWSSDHNSLTISLKQTKLKKNPVTHEGSNKL